MLATAKKNENKYDIKPSLVRRGRSNRSGYSRHFKSAAVGRSAYVSSSDWALHRSRRLGRWGIYSAALRLKLLPSWNRSFSGFNGESGRVGASNDVKNLARHQMKQFLIEQIPVLFFIAAFFLMLALGG